MLTLHHLNDSRSQRILWLLEELGTPYEMKRYQRNAETRLAPPELAKIHPLGKSPVITDGDTTIAESGAIVDYIIRRYGKGAMMPAPGSADYEAYNEWLHYSEGSAMLPLMLNLYVSRLKEAGAPLHPRIDSELANHLGYVDGALKGREFFVGASLTGADIQMSFVGEMAKVFGKLGPIPEPRGLAGTDARPAGVPAEHRKGRGVPVCVVYLGVVPANAGTHTPRPTEGGTLADAFLLQLPPVVMGPGSRPGRQWRVGNPFIPTISCINISPVPQALGQFRPMWYLAGTSFDRHT